MAFNTFQQLAFEVVFNSKQTMCHVLTKLMFNWKGIYIIILDFKVLFSVFLLNVKVLKIIIIIKYGFVDPSLLG